mmetsp:Transcript_28963/g.83262  ORF Transcript_28963/g.83262 Transcript_28963/m.83262 type:complete len:224 (+) Transcript_28963:224-895(+)
MATWRLCPTPSSFARWPTTQRTSCFRQMPLRWRRSSGGGTAQASLTLRVRLVSESTAAPTTAHAGSGARSTCWLLRCGWTHCWRSRRRMVRTRSLSSPTGRWPSPTYSASTATTTRGRASTSLPARLPRGPSTPRSASQLGPMRTRWPAVAGSGPSRSTAQTMRCSARATLRATASCGLPPTLPMPPPSRPCGRAPPRPWRGHTSWTPSRAWTARASSGLSAQ